MSIFEWWDIFCSSAYSCVLSQSSPPLPQAVIGSDPIASGVGRAGESASLDTVITSTGVPIGLPAIVRV